MLFGVCTDGAESVDRDDEQSCWLTDRLAAADRPVAFDDALPLAPCAAHVSLHPLSTGVPRPVFDVMD